MTAAPPERSVRASEVISLRADLLTVRVAEPLPPGTRIRLELGPAEGSALPRPTGKVVGLAREAQDRYVLSVRLHSLPRAERAAIEALVPGSPGGVGDR